MTGIPALETLGALCTHWPGYLWQVTVPALCETRPLCSAIIGRGGSIRAAGVYMQILEARLYNSKNRTLKR